MNREQIEAALDEGTLAIHVGRAWVPAVRDGDTVEFQHGWIIKVRGGTRRNSGIITNIDQNDGGRDFAFV